MECERPSSVASVLDNLRGKGNEIAFAEIKYDGERMQIHVLNQQETDRIRIFSKSGRNSTIDRKYTHQIINQTLDLCNNDREFKVYFGKEPIDSLIKVDEVVLEGELLVYNSEKKEIEPFGGIQAFSRGSIVETDKRYVLIKFFDILHLNGTSLLRIPFIERRRILDAVVRIIPTRVIYFYNF